jgi:CheY-like chemotaxis protein
MKFTHHSGHPPGEETNQPAEVRARILVVDDDKLVAWVLGELLKLLGYDPTVCISPRLALELLDSRHFDLIMCDWHMPDMDGSQFHAAVAARHPDLARQIMFLTGDISDDGAMAFIEARCAPLLFKPFQLADLKQALAKCLANNLDKLIATAA